MTIFYNPHKKRAKPWIVIVVILIPIFIYLFFYLATKDLSPRIIKEKKQTQEHDIFD